jgi:hypothetical protein
MLPENNFDARVRLVERRQQIGTPLGDQYRVTSFART